MGCCTESDTKTGATRAAAPAVPGLDAVSRGLDVSDEGQADFVCRHVWRPTYHTEQAGQTACKYSYTCNTIINAF